MTEFLLFRGEIASLFIEGNWRWKRVPIFRLKALSSHFIILFVAVDKVIGSPIDRSPLAKYWKSIGAASRVIHLATGSRIIHTQSEAEALVVISIDGLNPRRGECSSAAEQGVGGIDQIFILD